ncbi:hypothetical protein EJO68_10040 [Variovorax atrisoli]|uniref:hypothetical protein n=1 Tax=Variovorax atrisoli TaxID=3394203 RepID=UPI000F7F94C9|nr:hypothetical protein [Variovorax sp. 369]RTD94139.1 hypothetical protein EJO68_10040 [Variovorax sp. 369]
MTAAAQHTPGPVGVEVDGRHSMTVGRATVENSAILRGMARRKAERKELIDALQSLYAATSFPATGTNPVLESALRKAHAALTKAQEAAS